jgi:glycosyltransferase involved in cell wall biosynthesis
MRDELFGDAKLGILYSGTIGRAHQFEEFILLARELRKRAASVAFCFAGRGNCYQDLRDAVTPDDTNIRFAGFIEESRLPERLAAADIHMISLKLGWEGIVVPSKFFGSLAAGRPLLYCGTLASCVAELIQAENLGFIVDTTNISAISDQLEALVASPLRLQQLQVHAARIYYTRFSKALQIDRWDRVLRSLLRGVEIA